MKKYILAQSIQKIFNLILKKEALVGTIHCSNSEHSDFLRIGAMGTGVLEYRNIGILKYRYHTAN